MGGCLNVPYFNLGAAPQSLRAEWQAAFSRVTADAVFIGGPVVSEFEMAWATRLGVAGCVGVANGLDAITLALRAFGVGPGHRVAVPAHTFIATWLSVRAVGAETVGVDVDLDGQMDLDQLELLSGVIDAVIPVHMHGLAVDMPRVVAWARKHEVLVVEDCAQAHGATVGGRPVGSWGDAAAFSFYPTKNLGALGDAGAIVSDDLSFLDRVRSLANYGSAQDDKYLHVSRGVNSRLDPVQAAVLLVNLRYLDAWNSRRQAIAAELLDAIRSIPEIGRTLSISASASVWHHFILFNNSRDQLRSRLVEHGIGTEIHYPRLAAVEMAALVGDSLSPADYSNAQRFAREGLSLPLNQWMTDADVECVVHALRSCA